MSDTEGKQDAQLDLLADTAPEPETVVEVPSSEADDDNHAPSENDDDVQSQLKLLQNKLEEERRARREAEMRAQEAAAQASRAQNEVEDTNLQLIASAIDTVKRDNDTLKAHYRDAMAVGDYDRAAEIQESMSSNAAKLLQLENGRAAMEARPRQPARPAYADPVEDFASRVSPRSADWIRKNPQFVTDQRLQQKMIAAHNLAVADGMRPDSDEYFEHVESTLKIRQQAAPAPVAEPASPMSSASRPAARPAPPAAPVGRPSKSARPVRLSAAEVEMAKTWGWTEEEYAKNKLKNQDKMN